MTTTDPIRELQERLREFARARDWEQFHTPKNLAMALAAEVGELLEIFQWLTPEESTEVVSDPQRREQLEDELADVAIYLLRIADVAGVDLESVTMAKIDRNDSRFPAQDVRGRADYTPGSRG